MRVHADEERLKSDSPGIKTLLVVSPDMIVCVRPTELFQSIHVSFLTSNT